MLKRFLFNKRKLIFVLLIVLSIIQLPVVSSAYEISYTPVPDEDSVPDRPLYYGNADPYIPVGVGVSTIYPIADVDVFFSYERTDVLANYENASVTITDLYKSWVDGVLDYQDRSYVLENSKDFGYRNEISIIDPTQGDNAYFYHYDCSFDFGSNAYRLNSAIFRMSDFWYVPELKNPATGYTENIVRNIFSIDLRESYFNSNWGSARVSGSFVFMGTYERIEFDFHLDHLRTLVVSYEDIYNHALQVEDLDAGVMNPVPIYIEDLNIAIPLWNANRTSLRFKLDIPVQTDAEHDATIENAYVADFFSYIRYSRELEFGFDWFIDSISAFLSAPIFDGLSFGSLVFIVLSFSISTAVIAFLSHLR